MLISRACWLLNFWSREDICAGRGPDTYLRSSDLFSPDNIKATKERSALVDLLYLTTSVGIDR